MIKDIIMREWKVSMNSQSSLSALAIGRIGSWRPIIDTFSTHLPVKVHARRMNSSASFPSLPKH